MQNIKIILEIICYVAIANYNRFWSLKVEYGYYNKP